MMETKTSRPRIKHALTATAMAYYQARNAWRAWFRGYVAEQREKARRQQRGWGG